MRKIVRRVLKPAVTPQPPPVAPGPGPASPAAGPSSPDAWTEAPLPLPKGKRLISLRLDADVVEYFQSGGKGYQTRMNAVLRAWMEARKRRHT